MRILVIILLEILVLFGMVYLLYNSIEVANYLNEYEVLNIILNYIFFLIIVDAASRIIKYFYAKRHQLALNKKDNFHYGIDNIAKLLIGIGLFVSIFGIFGVDFKSLLTSLSIVAAAIAVITKEYINDFLVGIYFSFSKNFEINDYVKLGEYKGKIQEIDMLKIKLLNDDDDLVIIPNTKVYTNEIINYTKRDIRLMSIDFQVGIHVVSNVEKLEEELKSSLLDFVDFIETDSYNLKIVEMKKDYLDFKFQYTLKRLDRELQRKIRKKTVREVINFVTSKT